MDCLVQHSQPFWTGVVPHHGLPSYSQRNYFQNIYFQRKRPFSSSLYPGSSLFYPTEDEVDYPTDIKGELTNSSTTPYNCMVDDGQDFKLCVVCGEKASGFYFGALVCLPCKSFYIRCTKDGEPSFTCQCSGNCDIVKQGRIRCQYCRYQRCLMAGMCRKEKPETVQPAEGQVLCKVCGDIANGIHFGVNTCEGCKKFFRRGLVENQSYVCKGEKDCGINPRNRNNCRYCRYQKCLAVGMSREAIKMGRPKKADGSDCLPVTLSSSPKMPHHSSPDLPDSASLTRSSGKPLGALSPSDSDDTSDDREDTTDALDTPASNTKVKIENARQSCKYEDQANNNGSFSQHSPVHRPSNQWTPNSSSSSSNNNNNNRMSWHQPCMVSEPCYNGSSVTQRTGTRPSSGQPVSAAEFIEEEMDEILMFLQNDNNQAGQPGHPGVWQEGVWKGSKKLRSSGGYRHLSSDKPHKSEQFCDGSQPSQQWNMQEMPSHQGMPRAVQMNQPMNMSAGQMSPRQPPQYPGYARDYQQDQMAGGHSPCHSPGAQMAHSPGYVQPESPIHGSPHPGRAMDSPSCQYSSSPQHSQYHSDSSPMGSPFNNDMYVPQPFNHPSPYQQPITADLSVNVNCAQSSMSSHSPQGSPHHYPNSPMAQSPVSSSRSMTIPTQEGNCNTHESWTGVQGGQSPNHYCGSPLSSSPHHMAHSPATIPTQEGSCQGQQRGSPYTSSHINFENLQRINQYFVTGSQCMQSSLELIEDKETAHGSLTRSDIEREVILKTLASVNQPEPYFYVMSDGCCSSDGNTSSSSYDEFTSCRRINKRKTFDDADQTESSRSYGSDVHVGRYKRQMTQMYWKKTVAMEESFTMTTEKQALLEHLSASYNQMAQRCSEANSLANSQGKRCTTMNTENHQWNNIQNRIIENMAASVKFATQIPGFCSIHPEDKAFLCKNVTFMSAILMAGQDLYNPLEKMFREFWDWKFNSQNPFHVFQQHLRQLGERIHNMNMDVYEVAALCSLLFVATDFLDLAYPEALDGARRKIIGALQAYEMSKGNDPHERLSDLFALAPEIRHVGMWHMEMMKQMKVNTQLQEIHQHFNTINL